MVSFHEKKLNRKHSYPNVTSARIPKWMKDKKGLHLYADIRLDKHYNYTSKYIHNHIDPHKYCMVCIYQRRICSDNCVCALQLSADSSSVACHAFWNICQTLLAFSKVPSTVQSRLPVGTDEKCSAVWLLHEQGGSVLVLEPVGTNTKP